MKLGIRITVCIMMMAIALTMAVFTLADFRTTGGEGYVLGESDGLLAVYREGSLREPIAVTDIELDSLRQADREKILAGLHAPDGEGLQKLLEDLGS